jgi:hypothetical protein
LLFLENAVPAGIETADPMIDIRSQAYAISLRVVTLPRRSDII